MTTSTTYPDAHAESTSVDGYTTRSGVNQTFANIIAAAGTGADDASTTAIVAGLRSRPTSNQFSRIYRGFLLFDTSGIPASATINSITLSLRGSAKAGDLNGGSAPDLEIVASTPASNTAIASGDHLSVGTTVYGSVSYASFSTAGYNDITLSGGVTKAGITKLGCRLSWDRSGTFGGTWVSDATTSFTIYTSDYGSNKPTLVVDYTEAGGARRVMVVT